MIPEDLTRRLADLRDAVGAMLREREEMAGRSGGRPDGEIWSQTLGMFRYLLDLSPESLAAIRCHTSLVTGDGLLNYYHPSPPLSPRAFAHDIGYRFHTEDVPAALGLSEPPIPGTDFEFGVHWEGRVINADIARYQSCVSNLHTMGILSGLTEGGGRRLVLEIGGGYGGLARGLGEVLGPSATYVILDFPEMLMFSGSYLLTTRPACRTYVYRSDTFTPELVAGGFRGYDYALLPTFVLPRLGALPEISLMINMQSFQEMSPDEIDGYASFAREKLSGVLYSDNIECHPHNRDLPPSTVGTLLERHLDLYPQRSYYARTVPNPGPWFYRVHLGTPLGKGRPAPCGALRFVSGGDRFILDNRGPRPRTTRHRNWTVYLIRLAKKALSRRT